MGASVPDLAAEVADLLHQVNHRIRRDAVGELEPLGLTSAQMRAMRTLSMARAPMRMSALAESLGIVRRSATSVVDELEVRGFAERAVDRADGRAVLVTLTTLGSSTIADLRRRRRTAAGRLFAGLDRAELEVLRVLLQRLASPA